MTGSMVRCTFTTLLGVALSAAVASAHFVWIQSEPAGEEVLIRSGFGEHDGWDPDLVDRMAKSVFRLRTSKGLEKLAVALDADADEYRAKLKPGAGEAVLAETDFGIIQFGGSPPTHLRYTAKHLLNPPAKWTADKPESDRRIEIIAKAEGTDVKLTVLHLGKPLAGAKIKATTPKGESVEMVTDDHGAATWNAKEPGLYGCYVGTTIEEAGELAGKKYSTMKDYATLTFQVP